MSPGLHEYHPIKTPRPPFYKEPQGPVLPGLHMCHLDILEYLGNRLAYEEDEGCHEHSRGFP
jgi:hypothetical protein